MLVEINGDTLYFETVTRTGELVEAGHIARGASSPPPAEVEPPGAPKPGPKLDASQKPAAAPDVSAPPGS
jgi:hypothetical protein